MSGPVILVADDDRLVLATVSKGLENGGYKVIQAASGSEALKLCEEITPDLAILDIRMPDLNGIETAAALTHSKTIPFIIFSAYGDDEFVAEATAKGALGYLVKPLDVQQIIPTIETALQRANELKQLQQNEANLNQALNSNRNTSTAIGVLMERYRLSADLAFEMLRKHARSQRRKLSDVADEVISASDALNIFPRKD